MSAIPLPDGSNVADTIRRLRAIDAEFFGTLYANAGIIGGDVTIEGTLTGNDILSANWDGTIPVDLSGGADSGATEGYALDGSAGAAQFQTIYAESGEFGDFDVLGTLTLGTGGVLRTAASGQRLELAESFGDRINWYTADASESSPGTIFGSYAGSAGTGRLHLDLHSPQNTTRNTQTRLILKAQSASGASGPEVDVFATGTYNIQPVVRFQDFLLRVGSGSASAPGFSFNDNTDLGMYRAAINSLALAAGGSEFFRITNVGGGTYRTYLLQVLADTTGAGANMFIGTAGRTQLSTSSRKYKKRINYNVPYLADIELKPTKHWRIDDKQWRYSLIAEDLEAEDPLLVDGESPNINAIIAVMAAKINRLETKLQELEDAK